MKGASGRRKVQILAIIPIKENDPAVGTGAKPVSQEEQQKWIDTIFREQPYLENVYSGKYKRNRIVSKSGTLRFNISSGCTSDFPGNLRLLEMAGRKKRYRIARLRIGRGICASVCPAGTYYTGRCRKHQIAISPEHCLHCGNCSEHRPVSANRTSMRERYTKIVVEKPGVSGNEYRETEKAKK